MCSVEFQVISVQNSPKQTSKKENTLCCEFKTNQLKKKINEISSVFKDMPVAALVSCKS